MVENGEIMMEKRWWRFGGEGVRKKKGMLPQPFYQQVNRMVMEGPKNYVHLIFK